MEHPHLHCIVPCGGLSEDGKMWLFPRKSTKKKAFFVHVNVISDLFKKKFLSYFKKLHLAEKLKFVGRTSNLGNEQEFKKLCDELYEKKWISYIKSPFGGPEQVLEYLGRYTHRVAISNNRILNLEDGKVTFRYRDYQDGHKTKEMELEAFEFIRRFLLHVLPCRYFKIRYYGLFSNRNRKKKIEISKKLLGVTQEKASIKKAESREELLLKLTGFDPRVCPCCGEGVMVRKEELAQVINPPPQAKVLP